MVGAFTRGGACKGGYSVYLLQPSLLKVLRSNQRTHAFVRKRVQEHRDTFDPDVIRDFVDIYLDAERRSKTDKDEDMTSYTGSKPSSVYKNKNSDGKLRLFSRRNDLPVYHGSVLCWH